LSVASLAANMVSKRMVGRVRPVVEDMPGFVVASVDTVGAGDTFSGQFALASASRTPPADAVRRSCAAGALATTAAGAQSAAVTPACVAELLARAAVRS
jgi:ribokinase